MLLTSRYPPPCAYRCPRPTPTLSLAASLGVTFPFNVLVGIPIYYALAVWAHTSLGG
uniref:sodium-dependent bicarbonate transport family permease n=1 Tax=Pseudomonas hygromyciniae TaxID=2812000 RepID=UPI0035CBC19C